jgi:rare lipoprotein A
MGIVYVLWSWLITLLPLQQQPLPNSIAAVNNKPVEQTIVVEQPKHTKTGMASFYHDKFVGRKTATGEVFSNEKFTAASNFFKLGTYVKVTNLRNGKVVYVKVNDRMGHPTRVIDLTRNAARKLSYVARGITKVKIEEVPESEGRRYVLAQSSEEPASSNKL